MHCFLSTEGHSFPPSDVSLVHIRSWQDKSGKNLGAKGKMVCVDLSKRVIGGVGKKSITT